MKPKMLLAVLVFLLLPFGFVEAQPMGGEVGFIMQKDADPEFAYAIVSTIDFGEWSGKLLSGMTIAGVKSNAHWQGTNETYAVRTLLERRIKLKSFIIGIGTGAWVFMSTEKSDPAVTAFRLSLGFGGETAYGYLAGDVIGWDGADSYMLSLGLQLTL